MHTGLLKLIGSSCIGVGALAAATGCGSIEFSIGGQSVDEAAVEVIEDQLADELGFGALVGDCPEITEPAVGVEFVCTATTPDGAVITFDGIVDTEDHIMVTTSNVVDALVLPNLEAEGARVLNGDADGGELGLTDDSIDCGDANIVLDVDNTMICTVIEPATGAEWDAIYLISDMELGNFTIRVEER